MIIAQDKDVLLIASVFDYNYRSVSANQEGVCFLQLNYVYKVRKKRNNCSKVIVVRCFFLH